MAKVYLEITGDHTLDDIEKNLNKFEQVIERVFCELGFPDLKAHGRLTKVNGCSINASEDKLLIRSSLDTTNRSFEVLVKPKNLGISNSILVRLFIEYPEDAQNVYEKLMSVKQPNMFKAYEVFNLVVTSSAPDFDPLAWVLQSIKFTNDPKTISDDETFVSIVLDRIRVFLDPNTKRISTDNLFSIIGEACGYFSNNYNDEINEQVFEYLFETVVNSLNEKCFLTEYQNEGKSLYALGPQGVEFLAKFDHSSGIFQQVESAVADQQNNIENYIASVQINIEQINELIASDKEAIRLAEQHIGQKEQEKNLKKATIADQLQKFEKAKELLNQGLSMLDDIDSVIKQNC